MFYFAIQGLKFQVYNKSHNHDVHEGESTEREKKIE